mgnify:CR=1 FL=1
MRKVYVAPSLLAVDRNNFKSAIDQVIKLGAQYIHFDVMDEEFNGHTRENIRYINESRFPECKHVFKEKKNVSNDTVASPTQTQFANSNENAFDNLGDFEELLNDADVPF